MYEEFYKRHVVLEYILFKSVQKSPYRVKVNKRKHARWYDIKYLMPYLSFEYILFKSVQKSPYRVKVNKRKLARWYDIKYLMPYLSFILVYEF
jgi:hypothetical protein